MSSSIIEDLSLLEKGLIKSERRASSMLGHYLASLRTPEQGASLVTDIKTLLKVLKEARKTVDLIGSKARLRLVEIEPEIKVELDEEIRDSKIESKGLFLSDYGENYDSLHLNDEIPGAILPSSSAGDEEGFESSTVSSEGNRSSCNSPIGPRSPCDSRPTRLSLKKKTRVSTDCDKTSSKTVNSIDTTETDGIKAVSNDPKDQLELLNPYIRLHRLRNKRSLKKPPQKIENYNDSEDGNVSSDADNFNLKSTEDPNYAPNLSPAYSDELSDSDEEDKFNSSIRNKIRKTHPPTSSKAKSQPVDCPKCGKTLSTPKSLKRHLHQSCGRIKSIVIKPRTSKPSPNKDTNQRKKTNPSRSGTHYVKQGDLPDWPTRADGPPWVCSLCKKVFKTLATLKQHILVHAGSTYEENALKCTLCEKTFPVKRYLDDHMSYHEEVRKHTCDICSKSFKLRRTLTRHIQLVHSNAPPAHQCSLCGKLFKFRANHNRHVAKVHENYRPKKCHICSKAFKEKYHLDYHLKTHEKDRNGRRQRSPKVRKVDESGPQVQSLPQSDDRPGSQSFHQAQPNQVETKSHNPMEFGFAFGNYSVSEQQTFESGISMIV